MTIGKRFRWAILEDDRDWQGMLLRTVPSDLSPPMDAGSLSKLRDELARRPQHFISVDLNVPERNEEFSPHHVKNGLKFAIDLSNQRPLVRSAIYTAYSTTERGFQAGVAGVSDFIAKSHPGGSSPTALAPRDYIALVRALLLGGTRPNSDRSDPGYIRWALARATTCLPPSMALQCGAADAALGQGDWREAGRSIMQLREQVIHLAWAQASALCLAFKVDRATLLPNHFGGIAAVEDHLNRLWNALDRASYLGSWKGYITEQDEKGAWRSAGGAFLGDVRSLREIRNESSHFQREFSQTDYEQLQPAILALIDALAFWADNPLMNTVQIHPEDRRRLQFIRLSGARPWRLADILTTAEPVGEASTRRARVSVLHRDGRGERLVDLHPFVTMKSLPGQPPMPCLLIPPMANKAARWASLLDYTTVNLPLENAEVETLRGLFGNGLKWR